MQQLSRLQCHQTETVGSLSTQGKRGIQMCPNDPWMILGVELK